MSQSDEQLIEQFYEGQDPAFEELFQKYKTRVFRFALRMLNNRADAEDVAAEVFMAILRKKYMFRPGAKFSTWLYTVARNSCLSRLRQQKGIFSLWMSSGKEEEYEFQIPDSRDLPPEEAIKKERQAQVHRALQSLKLEQKEALVLREFDQLSYAEISEVMDCSLEKVKVLIFRAREHLAGILPSLMKEDQNG